MGTAAAKSNIAIVMAEYGGGSKETNEELLKKYQLLHKECFEQCGESAQITTEAGFNHASALHNANHCIEAERLLSKLAAKIKQCTRGHQLCKIVIN